jgi:hypothetical protein
LPSGCSTACSTAVPIVKLPASSVELTTFPDGRSRSRSKIMGISVGRLRCCWR